MNDVTSREWLTCAYAAVGELRRLNETLERAFPPPAMEEAPPSDPPVAVVRKFQEGYWEARSRVLEQSYRDDLNLLDNLFGRGDLDPDATVGDVKAEALRQLERDWTTPEWRRTQVDLDYERRP